MKNFADILFRQLAKACSESKQAFAQHIGVSQQRMQLLTLVAREGEISHADIKQQLSLDGATITRIVKQFESEGVLSRRLDPQNNRYTLVSLATSGEQLVARFTEAHRLFQIQLLSGITKEEQETMLSAFERLRTNISNIQEKNDAIGGGK